MSTVNRFNPGISVTPHPSGIGFTYGEDVFGPEAENRKLADIRQCLLNPFCEGPEIVYSIAMDVGKHKDRNLLETLHLLFGVVTYAAGRLGAEPVRSQGHVHKVSPYSGSSTPEIYEIWSGEAIIYMQETADDNPGRCYAVKAVPGDVVVVPPYWAHATISVHPDIPLTFGAWCDRAYGFNYEGIYRHKGIAWLPVYSTANRLEWTQNPRYSPSLLICKAPSDYSLLGLEKGKSIYRQFEERPEAFLYVANPQLKAEVWHHFVP